MTGVRATGGWRIAVLAAAALLAGCMTNFYRTPHPFEGRNRNDPMLDSILTGASVEIRPVEGLPAAEAIALSRTISDMAHDQDIASVTDAGARMADRLTGKAELDVGLTLPELPPRLSLIGARKRSLPVPGADGKRPALKVVSNTKIRFSWTLTAADGAVKDTASFTIPIAGARPALDKHERARIAEKTVAWLRATFDGETASPARAHVRQTKPVILVSPVEGASGDGRVSLTTALAEMLSATGQCEVLATSEHARIPKGRTAYRVKGHVKIADGGPDTQTVALAWTLTDLAGRELGTVNQQNAVPRGSLDGAWGQTAYDAALGAKDGLMALIARSAIPAPVE